MKRFHMHVRVEDIEASTKFYTALFGAEPVKTKADYAKWMLEDPRIGFAISTHGDAAGIDHVGIQVDDEEGLGAMREQLRAAEVATFDEGETTCCYAESDKTWTKDPSGVAWEVYRNMGEAEVYGVPRETPAAGCCARKAAEPQVAAKSCC